FSWATVMLFGKVPQDRQIYLSLTALGSVLWLIVVLGIVFPALATFLLGFVPVPAWLKPWTRVAMAVLAVLLPAVVGVLCLFLLDPEDRPKGLWDKMRAVVKGYPYTVGLAITFILMTLFAPVLKLQDVLRRWTNTHIPVIVEPG